MSYLNVFRRSVRVLWDKSVSVAPAIMASLALFFTFLVIAPFFLLDIHRVAEKQLFLEQIRYDQAFGSLGGMVGLFLGQTDVLSWVMTSVWLLSLANLIRTRTRWVAVALLLAPLPLAYYAAGPYASAMEEWLIYL